jgi:glycosyltransferase involved in cell wall biosynthesis
MNHPFFKETDRECVVVTSITPWHEPPRIRHQVARQLARFYNVLYVELPFNPGYSELELETINTNIIIYRPKKISKFIAKLKIYIPFVHNILDGLTVGLIEKTLNRIGYSSAILANFHPDFSKIYFSDQMKLKIYFCNDPFHVFNKSNILNEQLKSRESIVISKSDIVFAVSIKLLDYVKEFNNNAFLLLPGVETISQNNYSVTKLKPKSGIIKVAYMGYINERLELDWFHELLKNNKIELVLIGPVSNCFNMELIMKYKNLILKNSLEGDELMRELMCQDVLVMPYKASSAFSQFSWAPNKLFQYIAAGKPVVSSNINLLPLPDKFLYKAQSPLQFVFEVIRAYEDDSSELVVARKNYAAMNSWNVRGDELYKYLNFLSV